MKYLFSLAILILAQPAIAQVHQLPYVNGFNNSSERSEFVSIRTGFHNYDWSNTLYNNPFEYHDYPVGGNSDDTVSDWLFSPLIHIEQGTVLSFRYNVFSFIGTTMPADEFSIWYGTSDKNPFNGTFVKLADLTNKASSANIWQDTNNISIPFTSDSAYIAFRYRATNNWFTVGLDSVVLKNNQSGISKSPVVNLNLYPNPARNTLFFTSSASILSLDILSTDFRLMQSANQSEIANGSIGISNLNAGYYTVRLLTNYGTYYRKLCIE